MKMGRCIDLRAQLMANIYFGLNSSIIELTIGSDYTPLYTGSLREP
jgi:hypothetical protein